MADAIDETKRALRADLRAGRQAMSETARQDAASSLTSQLHGLVAQHGAASVSCYLSTPSEPDTRRFVREAVERGVRVLLPVTRADGLLDWAVATPDGETTAGLWDLLEPDGELLGPIAVNDVDLMIIPAAAVDLTGMRLGWGRGYFDKTIGSMERRPPVYAVVFDPELRDDLPRDVHDQPVTGVVTPTRTLRLHPAG